MFKVASAFLGLALAVSVGTPDAAAQELPRTHLKVHGMWSSLSGDKLVMRPFWTKHVQKASGGKITADYTTFDQLGLKGGEILRLLKLGVLDFGSGNHSQMASDFPEFNGTELWGVIQDMDTLKKAVAAYSPVLDKLMQEKYGAKLLFMWPNPPSIMFCRDPITSIDDLKGRKIRAYSAPLSDFLEGAGAVPVSVAFGEVVTALQRGTLDCGVTGSLSGNTSKWWEVTKYLYNLPGGISTWFSAVNVNSWNRLDPAVRDFLTKEFDQLRDDLWANGIMQMDQGITCNTGKGPCTIGIKANMTLVEGSASDKAKLSAISKANVVSRWAKRCGAECVAIWNETIGKVVGMTAEIK